MGELLVASVGLLVGGVVLLVVGRLRHVAERERRVPRSRGSAALVSVGVSLAATGALLLIAFVAIGMTMEPA